MEYRTIEGVEIATVGMQWPAMTGPHDVTFQDLADAMVAANDDPHIVTPRLKLGHEDPRFQDQDHNWDPTWDGDPAFGRVVNLRLENDGAVLVGDFVEVPAWLADAAPSAYPNRSMESLGDYTSVVFDHVTEGGKRYSCVITAVALLGPYGPAIRDLEDLQRVLTEGDPGLIDALPTAARASEEETSVPQPVAASVSTSQVRDEFNFSWATSEPVDGVDTYWWWARDIRVDPNEVIADDDEGGLWLIPFTTDGTEQITFDAPVRVREEFVPLANQPDQVAASAQLRDGQKVLASYGRPSKQEKPAAARSTNDDEEGTVPLTDDQRAAARDKYQLADDASDEEIIQAMLDAPVAEQADEPISEGDEPDGVVPEQPEPVAAAANERGVVIDKDAYAQLQADAAAGREARQEQLNAARGAFIDGAVKAGKFPPAAAAAYRAQLDLGGDVEAQTRSFIESLADNTVPVEEAGAVPSATAAAAEGTGWFPQLQKEA